MLYTKYFNWKKETIFEAVYKLVENVWRRLNVAVYQIQSILRLASPVPTYQLSHLHFSPNMNTFMYSFFISVWYIEKTIIKRILFSIGSFIYKQDHLSLNHIDQFSRKNVMQKTWRLVRMGSKLFSTITFFLVFLMKLLFSIWSRSLGARYIKLNIAFSL